MRNFLNLFQHPRFASEYDQNQIIIPDVSERNKKSSSKTEDYGIEQR